MKKVIFFTTFDYPTRFAHPVHGLEMATAFQHVLKENFLFVINTTKNNNLLQGINFVIPLGHNGRLIKKMHLRFVAYFLWLPLFLFKNKKWNNSETYLFINDPMLAVVAIFFKIFFKYKIIFECHGLYASWQNLIIFNFVDKVIFLTKGLADKIVHAHQRLKDRNIILSNAVDINRFIHAANDQQNLRKSLNLPVEAIVVGYTGRLKPLGVDKGAYLMIQALTRLPSPVHILFVGGTKEEIAEYRHFADSIKMGKRVHFIEHVDKNEIPKLTKICDILAYVPSGGNVFFQKETSPMKLFEYMASHKPILVSDLPTTREILDDTSAFFITPGDIDQLVDKIEYIMGHSLEAKDKSDKALSIVLNNSWINRVQRIIDFL